MIVYKENDSTNAIMTKEPLKLIFTLDEKILTTEAKKKIWKINKNGMMIYIIPQFERLYKIKIKDLGKLYKYIDLQLSDDDSGKKIEFLFQSLIKTDKGNVIVSFISKDKKSLIEIY